MIRPNACQRRSRLSRSRLQSRKHITRNRLGEFRRSQNWIGGSRPGKAAFVPPPPQLVESCRGDLERFLHSDTPPLVKAALAHVQFETIPFLDGNGRERWLEFFATAIRVSAEQAATTGQRTEIYGLNH
jgi:Fic family protein